MEIWLPVVGYEGLYEVSNKGRVRGVERTIQRRGTHAITQKARIKELIRHHSGYLYVNLSKSCRQRFIAVHVLVLEAFIGPRPIGMEGCHNDGHSRNNHDTNLRWDTHQANMLDQVRHGGNRNAAKTSCAQGHSFTEHGSVFGRRRNCRVCNRQAQRRRKARLAQERAA